MSAWQSNLGATIPNEVGDAYESLKLLGVGVNPSPISLPRAKVLIPRMAVRSKGRQVPRQYAKAATFFNHGRNAGAFLLSDFYTNIFGAGPVVK